MTCAVVYVERDAGLKVPVHENEWEPRNVYADVLCLLQMEGTVVRAIVMSSRESTTASIAAGVTARVACALSAKGASNQQKDAMG